MDETSGVQRSRRGRPMQDLTGRIFGHLLPVEYVRDDARKVTKWLCGCTSLGIGCVGHTGELKPVAATSLTNHRQFTCGCRKEYNLAQQNEGKQGHREEREATRADYWTAKIDHHMPESVRAKAEAADNAALAGLTDLTDTN